MLRSWFSLLLLLVSAHAVAAATKKVTVPISMEDHRVFVDGKVIDALSGHPGDVHVLKLDRKGATLTIKATIMHLI